MLYQQRIGKAVASRDFAPAPAQEEDQLAADVVEAPVDEIIADEASVPQQEKSTIPAAQLKFFPSMAAKASQSKQQ
jgi:hypothetical protein